MRGKRQSAHSMPLPSLLDSVPLQNGIVFLFTIDSVNNSLANRDYEEVLVELPPRHTLTRAIDDVVAVVLFAAHTPHAQPDAIIRTNAHAALCHEWRMLLRPRPRILERNRTTRPTWHVGNACTLRTLVVLLEFFLFLVRDVDLRIWNWFEARALTVGAVQDHAIRRAAHNAHCT